MFGCCGADVGDLSLRVRVRERGTSLVIQVHCIGRTMCGQFAFEDGKLLFF